MKIALALSLISLLGCGSVTILTDHQPDPLNAYDEYYDGWLLGFYSPGETDISRACPGDRIAKIRNYFSLEDVLISGITFGIYTPHTSQIVCAAEVKNASTH